MDINDKIAARRAQLEADNQKREAETDAALKAFEANSLESLASRLTNEKVEVIVEDGELAIASSLEICGIGGDDWTRAKLKTLLEQEARKLWTPTENRLAIGVTVAGVALLIPVWWLGLMLLAYGWWARRSYNAHYRNVIIETFPELFEELEQE